ncbi:hypothetical protein GCM10023085_51800 [Actinomadura viridis]|uniref:Uncharacterized protein n=1 Tax=Actinomadura viridis TaxID=58110 RepID=A0A931DMG3_9ACTN|nr:hypothetical protein [Actinomadura viridis]MBG6092242.1 hypothetical protein [Actinomadura viridis]
MRAEDDFGLWERELEKGPPLGGGRGGARGMLLVAALTAAGCGALITMGQVGLGAAGLILSSLVLLLWRVGM